MRPNKREIELAQSFLGTTEEAKPTVQRLAKLLANYRAEVLGVAPLEVEDAQTERAPKRKRKTPRDAVEKAERDALERILKLSKS